MLAELVKRAHSNGIYLSDGYWRTVKILPDYPQWVFKFNKYDSNGPGTNRCEWETYQFLNDNYEFPEDVDVPYMEYIDGVIVAERIYGEKLWWATNKTEWMKLSTVPIRDLSYDNVMLSDNGTIYIIDLGNGSNLSNRLDSHSSS